MIKNSIKVVSLVPSITETLIFCGVNLVGRSRFCIHPSPEVKAVPKVGGTKDVDWKKVVKVDPDIVILDKEENTLEMANTCPVEYFALHIQCVEDVPKELSRLALRLNNSRLKEIAQRWEKLLTISRPQEKELPLSQFPGVTSWWKKPSQQNKFIYLIWKDPWMAAGDNIFIQSVIDRLGFAKQRISFDEKYPQIQLSDYSTEDTVLFFSSEPFPFANYKEEMLAMGYSCALVDGELFSWYGVRSLEFLEAQLSYSC